MKAKLICPLICLIILLGGCTADEGTKPEEEIELTAPELAPLLNVQAGIDFAAAPRDVNGRWGDKPVRFSHSSR